MAKTTTGTDQLLVPNAPTIHIGADVISEGTLGYGDYKVTLWNEVKREVTGTPGNYQITFRDVETGIMVSQTYFNNNLNNFRTHLKVALGWASTDVVPVAEIYTKAQQTPFSIQRVRRNGNTYINILGLSATTDSDTAGLV